MESLLKKLFASENVEVVRSLAELDSIEHDIVIIEVDRMSIENNHTEFFINQLNILELKRMRNCVVIMFSGYDSDRREVYEVPEIRKWMACILASMPHLFYFLSDANHALTTAFLCIAKVKVSNQNIMIDIPVARTLIENITENAVQHSRQLGDSIEDQFQIANLIMQETGYDRL